MSVGDTKITCIEGEFIKINKTSARFSISDRGFFGEDEEPLVVILLIRGEFADDMNFLMDGAIMPDSVK